MESEEMKDNKAFYTILGVCSKIVFTISIVYIFFCFNIVYSIGMIYELNWVVFGLFIAYQGALLLIGLCFSRMLISKNCTTLELFPEITEKEEEESSESLHVNPFEKEEILLREHEMSICGTCNTSQPKRSYHCVVCNRCYLLMYKHLFWADICIGFTNYKFYANFLFYSIILSGIGMGSFIHGISRSGSEDVIHNIVIIDPGSTTSWVLLCIGLVIQSIILVGLLYEFILCTYSILVNKTPTERRYGGDPTISYDIGMSENWRHIMGSHWYEWMLPIWSTDGNGLDFPFVKRSASEEKEEAILGDIS
ncbi:palmitoyltransferase ZDHHC2/15/20 [Nematocida sp. LUAm3]|nr:palmitoyltransferase ZDHHC2/15/20 [Nematocida sp. LUAm3]KAI5173642.1 palmitoyltransferase ZDHHC2/15/20 [Nematocida sp. LUAm2]KAI5176863.1 palmitoyltransferase ZDHHC2/15/20 [Nematocida sp. LUAm1]